MEPFGAEDHAAASMVAALGSKRSRDEDSPDAAGGFNPEKMARLEHQQQQHVEDTAVVAGPPLAPAEEPAASAASAGALKPYPFFLYNDFSNEKDPDPLTPLTPPGRVPNFPAKMHSILSRQDLADIICWMPHGRSWRVLKPREFEVKVIPTYFEHAKFSSFIRQANGWGFRRITQGRDRNSYYHELFLRGLPHLCKKMKRPGVSEKQAADPEHEPDLYRISEMHPVPAKCDDDSILLQCTLQGGPKARMPIYTGLLSSSSSAASIPGFATTSAASVTTAHQHLTPRDQEALNAFQQSLGASENQFKNLALTSSSSSSSSTAANNVLPYQQIVLPPSTFATAPTTTITTGQQQQQQQPPSMNFTQFVTAATTTTTTTDNNNHDLNTKAAATTAMTAQNPLATANQLAFANPNMAAAAFQATSAASQFAAGFAAATALSQQQFKQMLDSFAAGFQQQHQQQPPPAVAAAAVMPPAAAAAAAPPPLAPVAAAAQVQQQQQQPLYQEQQPQNPPTNM